MRAIDTTFSERVPRDSLNDRLWVLSLAPESALETARWRKLLTQETRGLRTLLSEVFAAEEPGGYLADVIRVRPDLQEQVSMLKAQRAGILAGLDAVEAGLRDDHDVRISQARLRAVLALWRAHEHGEKDLVQESLNYDPSALDVVDVRQEEQR